MCVGSGASGRSGAPHTGGEQVWVQAADTKYIDVAHYAIAICEALGGVAVVRLWKPGQSEPGEELRGAEARRLDGWLKRRALG